MRALVGNIVSSQTAVRSARGARVRQLPAPTDASSCKCGNKYCALCSMASRSHISIDVKVFYKVLTFCTAPAATRHVVAVPKDAFAIFIVVHRVAAFCVRLRGPHTLFQYPAEARTSHASGTFCFGDVPSLSVCLSLSLPTGSAQHSALRAPFLASGG